MVVRVKVCGLTREEDVELCSQYPVACLGFVVEYPHPVPWNLCRNRAQYLLRVVPPFISTAIIVGCDHDTTLQIATDLQPDVVQLHGEERLEETARMTASIHSLGSRVIKAMRIRTDGTTDMGSGDPFEVLDLLVAAGVDGVVLDASSSKGPAGGTGRFVDWVLASYLTKASPVPVVLAGGLHAGNVLNAVKLVKPYAIDVLSGLEESLGVKSEAKLKALFRELAGAPEG